MCRVLADPVANPLLGTRSAHNFEALFGALDDQLGSLGIVVIPHAWYALLKPGKIWYTIERPRQEERFPLVVLLLEKKWHWPLVRVVAIPSFYVLVVV